MYDLNEFTLDIFGTDDGRPSAVLPNVGNVKLQAYDEVLGLDALYEAAQKNRELDKSFLKSFKKITDGRSSAWKLWCASICADRIAFNYYRHATADTCYFEVVPQRTFGVSFISRALVNGRNVKRETRCLMHVDRQTGICRTDITLLNDGVFGASLNIAHVDK